LFEANPKEGERLHLRSPRPPPAPFRCDSYIEKTPARFVATGVSTGSCFTVFYVKWLEMSGAR
jgi:hypothetical protein